MLRKFFRIPSINVLIMISIFSWGLSCNGTFETLEDYNRNLENEYFNEYFNVLEVIYPTSGKTNVPINSDIVVEFDDNIKISTVNDSTFIVDKGAGAVAGTATFDPILETVTFNPSVDLMPGIPYTVTLTTGILNLTGKSMESNYTWAFTTAIAPKPRIYIKTPTGVEIPSNYIYDMGTELNGSIKPVIFTIGNKGNADLTIDPLTLFNGTDYSCLPISSPIFSGNAASFTVTFKPQSEGTKTTSITIPNNDSDVNPFVLNFTGISLPVGTMVPEIEIIYKTSILVSSSYTMDFGDVDVGEDVSKTIVIRNIGTADLNITAITIDGEKHSDWFSTTFTPCIIPKNTSQNAVIKFKPLDKKKTKKVAITFTNNDSDEGLFKINLKGEGDD